MDMALIIIDMALIVMAMVIIVIAMAMTIVLLVVPLGTEGRCPNIVLAMRDATITNIHSGALRQITRMRPTIIPVLCHHLGMSQHMKMTASTFALQYDLFK